MVHIAGVSFCGPVSEGPHGRRPTWPISKPMVREFSLWHNGGMTSRLKRPRDLAQLKLMIDIASGEVKDHESPQKKTTKRKLPSRRSSRTQAT